MKGLLSSPSILGASLLVLSAVSALAAPAHRYHGYAVPYRVYGPCQTFHYQVVEIRRSRVMRAGLQPQSYCGVPREADPTQLNDSAGSTGADTDAVVPLTR
jgi:hypothetical protein